MTATDAFAAARESQPRWAATPLATRCAIIRKLGQNLADDIDGALTALSRDLKKPVVDGITGDLFTALEAIRYFSGRAPKVLRPRTLPASSRFFFRGCFYQSYLPYGVVLILGPFNYPIQLTLIPAICALLAGNTVIIKGSEYTPQTNLFLAQLFEKSGLAPEVVRILTGDAGLGKELCHLGFDKIFVTGGINTGLSVARYAAEKLIPVDLELGGKDTLIIARDAPLSKSAQAACFGAFLNSGQVCMSTKRVLVPRSLSSEWLTELRVHVKQIRRGESGHEEMGPLVRGSELTRARELIDDAVAQGAKIECPLEIDGHLMSPVVLSSVHAEMRILNEELFAPVLCVQEYENDDEIIRFVNSSRFALQAAIFSRNLGWARRIADQLCVGGVSINQVIVPAANPALPFGGEKQSGYGRSRGDEGLLSFCRKKSLSIHKSSKSRERYFFPYEARTTLYLKRFLKLVYGGGSLWSRLYHAVRS